MPTARIKPHQHNKRPHFSTTKNTLALIRDLRRVSRLDQIKACASNKERTSDHKFLITNESRIVAQEVLLENIYAQNAENVYSDCINKHIESLRRKLGPYGHSYFMGGRL